MFSRSDARALRSLAPPLDCSAAACLGEPLQSYLDHYRLRFTSNNQPAHHALGVFPGGGEQIVAQYFAPASRPRATVFLLHGYLDHAGLYRHALAWCLAQGCAAFVFDLPGHGLSSGESGAVDNFANYCQALAQALALARGQELPRPWFAVGQSTGGAVLIDSVLHHGLLEYQSFEGIALLAPLLRVPRQRQVRLAYRLGGWFIKSTRRHFSASSHDREFLNFLREEDALQSARIPSSWIGAMLDYEKRFAAAAANPAPLTIIQGTADATVDWQHNLPAIREKFPAAAEVLVPGARHHLVNESADFRNPVFAALEAAWFG